MSQDNSEEFACAAKLDNRHRGQLAEIAFVRKATSLGFAVAKPWGEGERYDFIVRVQNVCWRVQVKSVLAPTTSRPHYRMNLRIVHRRGLGVPYSSREIDFLVAYLFQANTWYVCPAKAIDGISAVCLRPGNKRNKYEPYREAWHLMQPASPESADKARTAAGGT